jgi:hypothetical protein
MNLRHLTARTAVAGVTAALAAGALVGIAAPAANAASVTNTYTCAIPSLYSGDFAVTVTGSLPVPQYFAGAPVPAGLVNVSASVAVPADAAGLLKSVGDTGAKSDDFALKFGTTTVPEPLSGTFVTSGSTTTWEATGTNKAFVTPAPGVVSAVLPKTFSLTATGASPVTLTCTLKDAPAKTLTSIQLLKQTSAVTAKAPKKVKKGKLATVAVTAKSLSIKGLPVTGNVVAKEGKKVLGKGALSKAGKLTLKLGKKLKVGKHKVTVTYLGNPSVKGSSVKTVVKVVK